MSKIKKYEYIDSLRGIAILLVINVHVWMANLSIIDFLPDRLNYFMQIGRYGVQLFFMVSSFTLVMSYHSRKNDEHATRNFFIRRVFRIIPMFYLAIVAYTFILFLGFNVSEIDFANVPLKGLFTSLFMVHGLFPAWTNGYVPGGWTVSAEFIFYLSLPFLCLWVKNLTRALIFFFGAIILAHIAHIVIVDSSVNVYDYAYFNFLNHVPAFSLGLLAYWLRTEGFEALTAKPVNLGLIAILIALIPYIYTPSYLIYVIALFLLMLTLSYKPYKLFSNRILAQIGKQSFSIYLIHFAVIMGIKHFWLGSSQTLLGVESTFGAILCVSIHYMLIFSLSFIISYFTYYYVEEKGIALGRKLIKKISK